MEALAELLNDLPEVIRVLSDNLKGLVCARRLRLWRLLLRRLFPRFGFVGLVHGATICGGTKGVIDIYQADSVVILDLPPLVDHEALRQLGLGIFIAPIVAPRTGIARRTAVTAARTVDPRGANRRRSSQRRSWRVRSWSHPSLPCDNRNRENLSPADLGTMDAADQACGDSPMAIKIWTFGNADVKREA